MKRFLLAALVVTAPIASHAGTYSFTDNTDFSSLAHGTAYTWAFDKSTNTGNNTTTGGGLNALETAVTGGQSITSATLTITGIHDWTSESADVLYVDLLNNLSTSNHGANAFEYDSSPDTNDTSFGVDPFTTDASHSSSYYEITHGWTSGGNTYTGTSTTTGSLLQYTAADGAIFTGAGKNDVTNPGTWSDPIGGGGSGDNFTLSIQLTSQNLALLSSLVTSDATSGQDLGLGLGPDCHYYISGLSLSIITDPPSVPDGGMTVTLLGLALVSLAGLSRLNRRSLQA